MHSRPMRGLVLLIVLATACAPVTTAPTSAPPQIRLAAARAIARNTTVLVVREKAGRSSRVLAAGALVNGGVLTTGSPEVLGPSCDGELSVELDGQRFGARAMPSFAPGSGLALLA